MLEERRTTRRELLRDAGAFALGVAAFGRFAPVARGAVQSRVVVVGAGLAGLTAAYRLKQAGCIAAGARRLRIGSADAAGRSAARSLDGQIAEHGGELIDQGHTALRQLAQQLGLTLDNLLQGERNGTEPVVPLRRRAVLVRGRRRYDLRDRLAEAPQRRLRRELPDAVRQLHRARLRARPDVDRRLDRGVRPGRDRLAARPAARRRLQHRVRRRVERAELAQPALPARLPAGRASFRIFGESNEKYHVRGGNDQIPARLADALAGQITLGSELVAVKLNSDGDATR